MTASPAGGPPAGRPEQDDPLHRHLGELVAGAREAMVAVDDQGRIVLANAAAEALLGRSAAQLAGRPLSDVAASGAPGCFVVSAVRDVDERRRSEVRFRRLLESAPDAMVIADAAGAIVLVNAQTERLFGYARDELLGQPVELLVPGAARDRHAEHRVRYARDPHTRAMGAGLELHGRRKDGSEFPVEISLSPLETDGEKLVSAAVRDISDRRRAEQDASHFRAVVQSSHDAIIGKDLDGRITSWNPGAERLYGYAAAEVLGKSIAMLVPPGHDDDTSEILRRVRTGERVDDLETVRARKDGTHVDVSLTVSPIRDHAGAVVGIATIARDISARRRYQEQLRFLAEHDALTGTRNRRGFERDISEQVGRARRYGEQAALLMIDVDDFKAVNDQHGHKTGDRALKAIAAALRRRLRETDVVARIGGDEFAVLLPYAGAEQAEVVRRDLRDAVAGVRVELPGGGVLGVRASVGLALIDRETPSDEAVLAEADRAMYREKLAGRPARD
ncbi:PAS domain S-box protein [Conexibacter sp. SYSU D00693]|uniref:sensor domain-containing diguanylate cyclase n=1 Tax=Conexibacter sp. SYSU D00693 TaxID=2812560 RepID=UPI00196A73C4|nr:PAS domain S-box protein [Conexibacter sp. SYSU D00693]